MTENDSTARSVLPIAPGPDTGPENPAAQVVSGGPSRERVLELIGLLSLIAVAATVYIVTGPEAFAAVTAVGAGLFTTWSGPRSRD
jgi:uncharacterized membrane protein YccC